MADAILPMPPFDWQNANWESFQARLKANKLPHAFLLAGQEGIGGEELALAMGQYLLCLSPMDGVVCGRCRGCQLLDVDTHPDLLRIFPEEGKQIKVDQIRDIGRFVDQTAQQGGYKVIILGPAESMNINAANALLKNLEEPAGQTVFFLLSHQLNRVLPTIRSRCAKEQLDVPAFADSFAWLQSMGVEDGEALLYEANAAPLQAKQWSDGGEFQQRLDIYDGLVHVNERTLEPMAFAKKWASLSPVDVLDPMLKCIDAVVSLRVGQRVLPKHLEKVARSLERSKTNILFRLRDRLCERKAQLRASPNLNGALLIEELALDWSAAVVGV